MTAIAESIRNHEIIETIKSAFLFALPDEADRLNEITLDSRLEDLGIESIATLEIVAYVEEKYDIQFMDDELASVNSVRQIVALVEKYARGNR